MTPNGDEVCIYFKAIKNILKNLFTIDKGADIELRIESN